MQNTRLIATTEDGFPRGVIKTNPLTQSERVLLSSVMTKHADIAIKTQVIWSFVEPHTTAEIEVWKANGLRAITPEEISVITYHDHCNVFVYQGWS